MTQWHDGIIFKKKLYLWLFNKTHYQIDEIIRTTRITFTMMKQVYKKWKSSEQICTGTVHWCEPLTAAPRETEEHSLYTSREYINLGFFFSLFFFFIYFDFFSHVFSVFFSSLTERSRYGGWANDSLLGRHFVAWRDSEGFLTYEKSGGLINRKKERFHSRRQ